MNDGGGGAALKVFDAGQANSVLLGDLLAGVDITTSPLLDLHVRTKIDAAGNLPSAWSSPALQVTIVGFAVPGPPTLDP